MAKIRPLTPALRNRFAYSFFIFESDVIVHEGCFKSAPSFYFFVRQHYMWRKWWVFICSKYLFYFYFVQDSYKQISNKNWALKSIKTTFVQPSWRMLIFKNPSHDNKLQIGSAVIKTWSFHVLTVWKRTSWHDQLW